MDEVKVVGFLFSILSVAFWRWVSAVERNQEKLEDNIRDIERNSLTKKEIYHELAEIKEMLKETQDDVNSLYRELQFSKKQN